jgi:single-stranded DNA-specific DHH superfamily exonuclease
MLPKKELLEIKKELDDCSNPMFIYDKDGDGLCSFLILYKYKGEGTGVIRIERNIDEKLLNKVKEIQPDKIFILDVPINAITQEFVDGAKVPIIHIDHHLEEIKIRGLKSYNPRYHDPKDSSPTTTICYNVVKQNLWLAAIGTVFDWHVTKETSAFAKEHPDLLDPKIKNPGKARFESKIGLLCTVINFMLKGKTDEIKKRIEEFKKIKDPIEILEQKTEAGEKIFRHYKHMNELYQKFLDDAEKQIKKTKGKLFVFRYAKLGDATYTSDLSNELIYRHPKKIIIIAYEKDDEMRCSLRSATVEIRTKLQKALEGIEGFGGGHDMACGAGVKKKDWDKFLERFKEQL